jgi:hypothetical protein
VKKPTALMAALSLFCLTAGLADKNGTIGASVLGLPAA